jgi:hypothetical protein
MSITLTYKHRAVRLKQESDVLITNEATWLPGRLVVAWKGLCYRGTTCPRNLGTSIVLEGCTFGKCS